MNVTLSGGFSLTTSAAAAEIAAFEIGGKSREAAAVQSGTSSYLPTNIFVINTPEHQEMKEDQFYF